MRDQALHPTTPQLTHAHEAARAAAIAVAAIVGAWGLRRGWGVRAVSGAGGRARSRTGRGGGGGGGGRGGGGAAPLALEQAHARVSTPRRQQPPSPPWTHHSRRSHSSRRRLQGGGEEREGGGQVLPPTAPQAASWQDVNNRAAPRPPPTCTLTGLAVAVVAVAIVPIAAVAARVAEEGAGGAGLEHLRAQGVSGWAMAVRVLALAPRPPPANCLTRRAPAWTVRSARQTRRQACIDAATVAGGGATGESAGPATGCVAPSPPRPTTRRRVLGGVGGRGGRQRAICGESAANWRPADRCHRRLAPPTAPATPPLAGCRRARVGAGAARGRQPPLAASSPSPQLLERAPAPPHPPTRLELHPCWFRGGVGGVAAANWGGWAVGWWRQAVGAGGPVERGCGGARARCVVQARGAGTG